MATSCPRAERLVRPAADGASRSGSALAAALTLLLCGAPAGVQAFDDAIAGRWTISLAPSVFAPRMNGLNNALATDGVNLIQAGAANVGLTRQITGYRPLQWGYGGQIDLQYQMNDDIRGGLRFGLADTLTSDRLAISQDTNFTASCTGCPVPPAIRNFYDVSEKMNLPLVMIGLSIQKVFLFEEEPNLSLYLGGSGMYTTLMGAAIHGVARHFNFGNPDPPDDESPYKGYLTGQGWGFGGTAGGEYILTGPLSLFLESGFDLLHVPNVQASLRVGPVSTQPGTGSTSSTFGRLKTVLGKPIELDFSGVFIRLGVRWNLTTPQ